MAQYIGYANYVIWFADPAEYTIAVATAGGNFLETSPANAASLFGITLFPPGQPGVDIRGIYGFAPYGIPGPPGPGVNVGHPLPSGVFLTNNVNSVVVPGQAGNPASIWPAGPDLLLKWSGAILRAGGENGANPTPAAGIPRRRWLGGPASGPTGDGGSGINEGALSRLAGRTIDSTGYIIRGNNNATPWTRAVDEYRTGLITKTSWERFYVRCRTFPTTNEVGIWRCQGLPSLNAGAILKIGISGGLKLYNVNAINVEQAAGSATLSLVNEWNLIDILVKFDSGVSTTGTIRIYLNHSLVINFVDNTGFGMNSNTSHIQSQLGKTTAAADDDVEIDLTDWINADVPNDGVVESLDSIDWNMGSHVRTHRNSGSASLAGWAGNRGVFDHYSAPFASLSTSITSTTSGATAEAQTNAINSNDQDSIALIFGAVSAIISQFSSNSALTDGTLGYKIAGGAAVLSTVNQVGVQSYTSMAYLPSPGFNAVQIAPFSTVKTKSVDGATDVTNAINNAVEYVGTWGPEDDPAYPETDRFDFLHNCRYANTPWGYLLPTTDAPTYAVGGTYVGNGTIQTISLPAPAHFIWIRATSGAPTGGVKWFAASVDAHFGATDRVIPNLRPFTDIDGNAFFTVDGSSIEINQAALTYQYIVFCDPGMRFLICGAFQHSVTKTQYTNGLVDPTFTAQGVFAQNEVISTGSLSNIVGLSFKGPGHTGNIGTLLDGNNLANWGQILSGVILSRVSLHINSQTQVNYAAFRTNEPNCAGIMCQMFSFVGDGTASRTISVTPAGGRFPLFVLVMPINGGNAYFKDPSHVGNAASNAVSLGATIATAIISVGVDTITVGVTCNAAGVTHNVFIIPGDSAGFNNGVFYNPNCEGLTGPIPKPPPSEPIVLGDGGLILGGISSLTLLLDASGIYTLIPNQRHDTYQDRLPGQATINEKIPDPFWKTGFIGG